MGEATEFFVRPQNTTALKDFRARLDAIQSADSFATARNDHIRTIIASMASNPAQWDAFCEINIGWIGQHFIDDIAAADKELSKDELDNIFSMCFRFLFELYLSTKNDLQIDFEMARKFAFKGTNEFAQSAREQIEYAIRDMPINILKSLTNSDSIQSIKEFNDVSRLADTKRNQWEAELSEREKRVANLKEALSTYESAFNFVGLFEGFNDLAKDKNIEKRNTLNWLKVVSFLVVLPLISEIVVLYINLDDLNRVKNVLALSIIPTISLVAIFVYYFRVILYNYKSVKSQLLQIELRKTLCRFIQNYSEYSGKLKEKDKDALAKFENIVFSGIVSDDGNLPSIYDGVEQLAKLIKSART